MFWLFFLIFFAACAAAGATGSFFDTGSWYKSLNKPSWNPPNWVFPVAWTTIYILISFAGARVAVAGDSALALAIFALQFPLNTLWTPVFFGLRRIRAGLFIVAAMWVTIAAATVAFFMVDVWAGVLMLPYLGWVTVATALNQAILRLNPDVTPLKPSEI